VGKLQRSPKDGYVDEAGLLLTALLRSVAGLLGPFSHANPRIARIRSRGSMDRERFGDWKWDIHGGK
jgi:hypothetical protein